MKLSIFIAFFAATFITYSEALVCWTCETEPSNDACNRNGRLRSCQPNQGQCQNEVRRFQNSLEVSKRCKQRAACDNNELQNKLVGIGAPTVSQCTARQVDSTCRCCCGTDMCNNLVGIDCLEASPPPVAMCRLPNKPRNGFISCTPAENVRNGRAEIGVICRFGCDKGLWLIGRRSTTCARSSTSNAVRFNNPTPSCLRRTCFPPRTNPRNGKVGCTDANNAGSSCTYSCNLGYSLRIGSRRTTYCNGFTSRWNNFLVPPCDRIVCLPRHGNPRRGRVRCTNRNFLNSVCRFTCDKGYLLEGATETTCTHDGRPGRFGRWTNRAPVCKRIRCLPVQTAPDGGSVTCSNGNSEGSVCSFSCNAGFYLDGSSSTTCEDDGDLDDDGVWTASPPTCVRITCRPPQSNPINGRVRCSNRNFLGSTCRFNCGRGFFLEGPVTTICEDKDQNDARGEWSNRAPTCSRITCSPTQVNPENGDVTCSNGNNLNSLCRFECQEGFAIIGQPVITCDDDLDGDNDGVWSALAPTCGQIICNPPHTAPVNGFVSCTNANIYGSECSFRCDAGFSLAGSRSSVCRDGKDDNTEGEWSAPAPACVQIICIPPRVNPANGVVACSNQNILGSECRYTCNEDYFLSGSSTTTCIDDGDGNAVGEWNNAPPTCLRITCKPPLVDLTNGNIVCSNSNLKGSICRFTCRDNFFLNGASSSTCEDDDNGKDEDGKWSNELPSCVQVTCVPPRTEPQNGDVSCTDRNNAGSICRYSCDVGFIISDTTRSSTVCEDDNDGDNLGEWSQPPPTCVRIKCSPPHTNPNNGEVLCSDANNYASECTFTCNFGFYLNGSSSSTCEDDRDGDEDGVWSDPAPVCSRVICNPPNVDPTNGRVTCSLGNRFSSSCVYECNSGFFLDGSAQSVCEDDRDGDAEGVWSAFPPVCVRITCNPPHTDPTNGVVICSNQNFENSVCSFTCNDGYFLRGFVTSTCVDDGDNDADGAWDNPAPTCARIICNPPRENPVNGTVSCSDRNNEDSVCTYTCNNGFFLNGASTTTCEDDQDGDNQGLWSNPPPVCVRITCTPSYVDLLNGGVSCTDDNNQGSVCSFSCNNGYFLDGSSTTTCVDDNDNDAQGIWTELPPTCVRITCPPPHQNPTNGNVDCSNSNFYQSVCSFTCTSGFFLNGEPTSTCEDDEDGDALGVWSSLAPVCVAITCSPPRTDPENGQVTCSNGNFLNSQCSYRCDVGYFLNGRESTTCQDDNDGDDDGVWSEAPPTCIQIVCNPPHVNPINGIVSCNDSNSYGSVCSFTCNDGFFLSGSEASVCIDDGDNDPDGIWNNPAPTCVRIICIPPRQNPANGSVSCTNGNSEDSVCTYTCNDGFFLNGPSTTTCEDDQDGDNQGLWSNPVPPICVRITCTPSYVDLLNGGVSCTDDNNQGSVCSFTCNNGYFLDGSSTTTCVDDNDNDAQGIWTELPPTCVRITCPPPHRNPTNGSVDCSNSNFYQSVCSFTCTSAFFLNGEPTSTCEDDEDGDALGVWSSLAPVCVAITCNPPRTSPDNGQVTCSNRNFLNSQCSYQCDVGYFLDGQDTSTCQDDEDNDADGLWSAETPSCVRITCIPPHVNPTNGIVVCSDANNYDSTCSFTCNDGFFLSGSEASVCIDDGDNDPDGIWNNPAPTCVRIICIPPRQNPVNGSVSCSNGNSEDSVCTYTCNDGFFLNGPSTTTCEDDQDGDNQGLWSNPVPPVCVRITCTPSYVDLLNGGVSCTDDNNQGSVCSFTCNNGYFLDGSSTTTCVDDNDNDAQGIWTELPPTCVRITCPPPHQNPTNGSVDCSNSNFYQSVCSFTCTSGFFLNGEPTSTCEDDEDGDALGVWSSLAPVCVAITCNPPRTSPDNGQVTCSNRNFLNSQCSYQCDVGYFLDGQDTSTCQDDEDNDADGLWSAETPSCVRITCIPPHVNPTNGIVVCSDANNYDSTCSFTCNDGFFLSGSEASVCIDDGDNDPDGIWNNPAPTCVRIICIPPRQNPVNGSVSCSNGNSEDSVCTYTCNDGFFLNGPSTTTCEDDQDGDNQGLWSNPVPPVCVRITCTPSYVDLLNGGVSCTDDNNQGSVCSFTCNNGYFLDGSSTTTCVDDNDNDAQGVWTELPPTCVRITCPPPHQNPTNGNVDCSNSNFYQSACSFTCTSGFFLNGEPTSTCEDDEDGDALGVWSSLAPVCVAITCNPPRTNPDNGQVTCSNGNFFNSQCSYQCNNGYFLDGQATTTCEDDQDNDADGVWSSEPPTCVRITCIPPHVGPSNGVVVCSDSNFNNSMCFFTCNDGYFLNGEIQSVCVDDNDNDAFGSWTNPPPTCSRIVCNPPRENPQNGTVVCTDSNYIDSVCTFTCETDFFLRGQDTVTCVDEDEDDEEGTWSAESPVCQLIQCFPIQTDPENGNVVCSNENFAGSVCRFTCDTNYYVSGVSETTCIADQSSETGTWSDPTPTCQRVTCVPRYTQFPNGVVTCSDENFVDSVCRFSCVSEYRLNGTASITCNNDDDGDEFGEWSGPPPFCQRVSCTPPFTSVENGVVTCSDASFINSECEISCIDDYHLNGTDYIACVGDETAPRQDTAIWTDSFPTCITKECVPAPEAPENGFRVCTNGNLLNSRCDYGCNEFHRRIGPANSTCVEESEGTYSWTNQAPTCQAIICPAQTLQNGNTDCDDPSLIASTVCSFSCNPTYVLFPEQITNNTCLIDSSWSVETPCCAKICPPNADMDLVLLLDSSTSINVGNWGSIQSFAKMIIDIFDVGPDSVEFAIARFGRVIDRANVALFNQFRNDKAGLKNVIDSMRYNSSETNNGTFTGNALRFVRNTLFAERSGNRPGSQDVILLITDGRAQDDVETISRQLRDNGVLIYVIGVYPPWRRIGFRQLVEIAGDRSNVFLPTRGFADLDERLATEISRDFCPLPCSD